MPTKIRLQRRGRKAAPFYHIVIADGRAPRDGKFIEKIGTYNPVSDPADIQLNFDRALYWLQTGAQPTDTVKNILSYKGVVYKNHLLKGVTKGALTEEQAEAKFQAWLSEKEAKIENLKKEKELARKEGRKKSMDAEKLVKETRARVITAKRVAAVEEQVQAVKEAVAESKAHTEEAVAEETTEAVAEETTEAVVEETTDAVAEETPAAEEAPTAENVEEPVAEEPAAETEEKTEEEPKAEEQAEEAAEEEKTEETVAEDKTEEGSTEETDEEKK